MTILEQLQEKYFGVEGIDDARNIAEALACIYSVGGRGSGSIAGIMKRHAELDEYGIDLSGGFMETRSLYSYKHGLFASTFSEANVIHTYTENLIIETYDYTSSDLIIPLLPGIDFTVEGSKPVIGPGFIPADNSLMVMVFNDRLMHYFRSEMIPIVEEGAFEYLSPECIIIVPEEVYDDFVAAPGWSDISEQISVFERNEALSTVNGNVISEMLNLINENNDARNIAEVISGVRGSNAIVDQLSDDNGGDSGEK